LIPSIGLVSSSNLGAPLGRAFLVAIALAPKLLPVRLVLERDATALSIPIMVIAYEYTRRH